MSDKEKWYAHPAAIFFFWAPLIITVFVFGWPVFSYAASKWADRWEFNWTPLCARNREEKPK